MITPEAFFVKSKVFWINESIFICAVGRGDS